MGVLHSGYVDLFLIFLLRICLFSWPHAIYLFNKIKGAQLQKHIDATLGSGNLREAVRLPPGEDINEWLAVNSKCNGMRIYIGYV